MSDIVGVMVKSDTVDFDMRGGDTLLFFIRLNEILEKMQKNCSGSIHLYNRGENRARAVCVQEVLTE